MNQKDNAAGVVSIDTPQFYGRLTACILAPDVEKNAEITGLIAHIDAYAAQRYEAGKADQTAFLKECLDKAQAEFIHKWTEQKERADAAEASLARLVEALKGIAEACNCCGDRAELSEIAANALALLPAKAEAEQPVPKLYRFDVLDQRGTALAEGIGVHAIGMQQAEEKARKMMEQGEASIRFKSNAPCHPTRKCAICSTSAADPALYVGVEKREPDARGQCAATPAPAMGEEPPALPDFPEPDYVLTKGVDVSMFWSARTIVGLMIAYGRACMALRQPDAVPDQAGDIFDLIREWAHLPEGSRGDVARKIIGRVNQSYMAGVKDTRFLIAATAPASQPAAQEPLAYISDDALAMLKAGHPITMAAHFGPSPLGGNPIYATPPQPVQAELSRSEMANIYRKATGQVVRERDMDEVEKFARAILDAAKKGA